LFSKRGNYFLANEPANEFASAFDLSSQRSSNHFVYSDLYGHIGQSRIARNCSKLVGSDFALFGELQFAI
jgi:hypothetical protein